MTEAAEHTWWIESWRDPGLNTIFCPREIRCSFFTEESGSGVQYNCFRHYKMIRIHVLIEPYLKLGTSCFYSGMVHVRVVLVPRY